MRRAFGHAMPRFRLPACSLLLLFAATAWAETPGFPHGDWPFAPLRRPALPETRPDDEIEAFLADPSSQAYEHVVERLLNSPRFGERWARHWLDVVRFADTA